MKVYLWAVREGKGKKKGKVRVHPEMFLRDIYLLEETIIILVSCSTAIFGEKLWHTELGRLERYDLEF